jgi:hypothetical protein
MFDKKNNDRNFSEWKNVRVLYENRFTFNEKEVGVTLVARKPVFQNGNEGRLQLALVISRDKRYLYFPLYDQMWDELRFVCSSMSSILESYETFREEYMEIVKQDRAEYHSRRARELQES